MDYMSKLIESTRAVLKEAIKKTVVKFGDSKFIVVVESDTEITIRSLKGNWFVWAENDYLSANIDVANSVGWQYKASNKIYPEFLLMYAGHVKGHHSLPRNDYNMTIEAQKLFDKAEAVEPHTKSVLKDYVDMLRAMSYADGHVNKELYKKSNESASNKPLILDIPIMLDDKFTRERLDKYLKGKGCTVKSVKQGTTGYDTYRIECDDRYKARKVCAYFDPDTSFTSHIVNESKSVIKEAKKFEDANDFSEYLENVKNYVLMPFDSEQIKELMNLWNSGKYKFKNAIYNEDSNYEPKIDKAKEQGWKVLLDNSGSVIYYKNK